MREKPYFLLEYELQWFAKDGEGGEKTEPATAKKLRDARNEGKVAKSQELNHAVSLIALFLMLKIFISSVSEQLLTGFSMYNKIPDIVNESIGVYAGDTYRNSGCDGQDIINFGTVFCNRFFFGSGD